MKVGAIQCPFCMDVVYSRARHDMRYCSCGKVAIDGGRDYSKLTGPVDMVCGMLEVPETSKEMYDDWGTGTDKLGIIKGITIPKDE